MNKDDDLNNEKMVEKCCSCVGWGSRSGTKKRWARPALTIHVHQQGMFGRLVCEEKEYLRNVYSQCGWQALDRRMSTAESLTSPSAYLSCRIASNLAELRVSRQGRNSLF